MDTTIDDAIQAAETQGVASDEDLNAAHGEVKVLAGKISIWVKEILGKADEALVNKNLEALDDLGDLLEDVKDMIDKRAGKSSGTGRHEGKQPGRIRKVGTFLATPRTPNKPRKG